MSETQSDIYIHYSIEGKGKTEKWKKNKNERNKESQGSKSV